MSWVSTSSLGITGGGSGSPGGSNGQIQFNQNGNFGGSANFVWNNSSSTLIVGTGNHANNLYSAVFGNNNNIQESSHNIVIIGNNFNIDPTSNNTLYTDNLHIPSGGTVNGQPANNVFANTYTTGATFNNTTNTLLLNNNSGSSITTQITSIKLLLILWDLMESIIKLLYNNKWEEQISQLLNLDNNNSNSKNLTEVQSSKILYR